MIFTSYYAKLRALPTGIVPVSIALYSPHWYKGKEYKPLAPTIDILREYKASGNSELYETRYAMVLDSLNCYKVLIDLYAISFENDVVLMCYEKPTDFCHRHLAADWLNRHGIACQELDI